MYFLLRRLAYSLFLLVGASLLTFAISDLAPGDFFESMRLNPAISPATVAAIRAQHGADRALPARYVRWVGSILQGDWGYSFAYNSPARPILAPRVRNTLLLAAAATLLAWMLALPLGIWVAVHLGTWTDWLSGTIVSLLIAIPELVVALLLLLLAIHTGWLPSGGLTSADQSLPGSTLLSDWKRLGDIIRHLVLPAVCLAAGLLPTIFLHVRTSVKETLQSPFVVAARGYGIPQRRILLRHVLPAAANPLISLLGLSAGLLMSSTLLVEVIFSWPGLGQLMVEAIMQRDYFLVIDASILATSFLIAANLIADLLLFANDPRIRAE